MLKIKKAWLMGTWVVLSFCLMLFPFSAFNSKIKIRTSKEIPKEFLQTKGFDISWHNGKVIWPLINMGKTENQSYKFVFIKATEGVDFIDPMFTTNWFKAKAHNFSRGAYHFYNVNASPRTQALNFINQVKLVKGDLPPVLDFETLKGSKNNFNKLKADVLEYLQILEKHYGVKPILYTNYPLYKKFFSNDAEDYLIWISDFTSEKLLENRNFKPAFWQYSETGFVSGIDTDVDLNVFLGSTHALNKLKIQ